MAVDTLVTVIDVPQFAREMGLASPHEEAHPSVEDGPSPHGIPLSSVGGGPSDDPGVRPLSELLAEQVGVTGGAGELWVEQAGRMTSPLPAPLPAPLPWPAPLPRSVSAAPLKAGPLLWPMAHPPPPEAAPDLPLPLHLHRLSTLTSSSSTSVICWTSVTITEAPSSSSLRPPPPSPPPSSLVSGSSSPLWPPGP